MTLERDQLGRMTRIVDPRDNFVAYRYDQHGNLVGEIKQDAALCCVLGYDAAGNVTKRTDPNETTYGYTYRNDLKTITTDPQEGDTRLAHYVNGILPGGPTTSLGRIFFAPTARCIPGLAALNRPTAPWSPKYCAAEGRPYPADPLRDYMDRWGSPPCPR